MGSRLHRLLISTVVFAALAVSAAAQARGEADVAIQGYYFGGSGVRLQDVTGSAFSFRTFIPQFGLLKGSFQGYNRTGGVQLGDNYLEWQGAAWLGRRWTLTGGDYRLAINMVENPFNNIYFPELTVRGFKVEAARGKTRYRLFWGLETLQNGPRITLRSRVPQNVIGASAQRSFGERFQVAARLLHFSSSASAIEGHLELFPVSREFLSSSSLAVQASYSFSKTFKLFGEVSASKSDRLYQSDDTRQVPVSLFFGPSWETAKWTVRANYVYQGVSYFPALGYFVGDRRGPFGEIKYKPYKGLEVFGSASRYSNNLEQNHSVASYQSRAASAGASVALPWQVGASAQITQFNLTTQNPNLPAASNSDNRQWSFSLNRPFGGHRLRLSYRDLNLNSTAFKDRQTATEVEDSFRMKGFNLSSAARIQSAGITEHKTSWFFRETAQGSLGRFTLMAQAEFGRDLANQTVFATNAYKTMGLAISAPLTQKWNISVEAFRDSLATQLNPESAFVLGSSGIPLSSPLSALNHWNLFIRITRQIRWGGGMPAESMERLIAEQIPLVGDVEGFVEEILMDGKRPVAGIPVSLDDSKTVMTGEDGRFRLTEVPEGLHKVTVENELPAEFDPGPQPSRTLQVLPRRTARAELNVVRLLSFQGKVNGPKSNLENLLILLSPGDRYTTTDGDGAFAFYGLREGDYEVKFAEKSLPENGVLKTPASVPVSLRRGGKIEAVSFDFEIRVPEKPIRKILERHVTPDEVGARTQPTEAVPAPQVKDTPGRRTARQQPGRSRNAGSTAAPIAQIPAGVMTPRAIALAPRPPAILLSTVLLPPAPSLPATTYVTPSQSPTPPPPGAPLGDIARYFREVRASNEHQQ
jgi:predicted porin